MQKTPPPSASIFEIRLLYTEDSATDKGSTPRIYTLSYPIIPQIFCLAPSGNLNGGPHMV